MNRKPTFAQILQESEKECARRLWRKARLASGIAKLATGSGRRLFYDVKTEAMQRAVAVWPKGAFVDQRTLLANGRILFGVTLSGVGGLHIPAREEEFWSRLKFRPRQSRRAA